MCLDSLTIWLTDSGSYKVSFRGSKDASNLRGVCASPEISGIEDKRIFGASVAHTGSRPNDHSLKGGFAADETKERSVEW